MLNEDRTEPERNPNPPGGEAKGPRVSKGKRSGQPPEQLLRVGEIRGGGHSHDDFSLC